MTGESGSQPEGAASAKLNGSEIAAAWKGHARGLANWVERHLVNRRDVFGGYWRDGSEVKLTTVKTKLTNRRLIRHFQGTEIRDVVGLHAIGFDENDACTSKWIAIDIDFHGEGEPPECTWRAALAWYGVLKDLGFQPLLCDSNGKGGYHVRVVFTEPVPSELARSFGLWLTANFREHGLSKAVEVFPKQCTVKSGKFGSWLRVVGRHYKREHWTRVWDDTSWNSGEAAIDLIVKTSGDSPELIPPEARTFKIKPVRPKRVVQGGGPGTLDELKAELIELESGLGDEAVGWTVKQLSDAESILVGRCPFPHSSGTSSEADLSAGIHDDGPYIKCLHESCTVIPEVNRRLKARHARPKLAWGSKVGEKMPEGIQPWFTNCRVETDEEGKKEYVALGMSEITDSLSQLTGGWPKRVAETLFVATEGHKPVFLESAAQLFGAIDQIAQVVWQRGPCMVTQERFFEYERKFGSDRFDVIERAPHHPPMEGAFYLHPPITQSGSGGVLDDLIGFFTPATDEDHELIRAAFLTPFWGGPPGRRPAFRLEGPENDPDRGRGTGKTTLATTIASLAGGLVKLEPDEDFPAFITRLLSTEHGHKRVVLVDNVKKARFSWAPLEEFITSPVVSGHALYRGEAQRPNTLTVFVTVNGGTVSKDLAQRLVPIRLARPIYSARWDELLAEFIEENRQALICEIIATLASKQSTVIANTRWGLWEQRVLGQCKLVDACQKLIAERGALLDDDDDDAYEFEKFIADKLQHERLHKPNTEVIKISTATMAEWLSHYENGPKGKPIKPNTATTLLNARPLTRLRHERNKDERFWVWRGQNAEPDSATAELKPDCSPKSK
jgi:hypothetical protein